MTQGRDGEYPTPQPEMGERYDWIGLYTQRHACSDTYRELAEQQNALLTTFAQQGSERLSGILQALRERPDPDDANTDTFLEFLGERKERLRAEQEELVVQPFNFQVALHELDEQATENTRRYSKIQDELNSRHQAIGNRYEQSQETPPPHITRAIGHPNNMISPVWSQVCGAIEAFRFASGETRSTVTLGVGLGEAWSQDTLSHVVSNIQHLQLLQIALSDKPQKTAMELGRLDVLAQVGMPPLPTDKTLHWEEGGWLHTALQYLALVEPHHEGLQIDSRPPRLG